MAFHDEICTAKALEYRKVLDIPAVTTQSGPINRAECMTSISKSTRDQELRRYDAVYPRVGLRDGRATNLSYRQRGYDMEAAQRVFDWERKHPRIGDDLAATESYFARDARFWDRRPSSIEAPAVRPLWYQGSQSLTPDPYARMFPPKSLLPQSYHVDERLHSRPPVRKLKLLNLRSAMGSMSPRPTCAVVEDQFKIQKIETTEVPKRGAQSTEARKHPPVSYLTERSIQDKTARDRAQADYLQKPRRKQQETEETKQERDLTVKKKRLEDVPAYIKDLARSWRERNPGTNKLFKKDFDFGPRTQVDDDNDYQRPLSPLSPSNLFSEAFTETRSNSLKRQRHDSSNPYVARKSPHDRCHTTTSPIPMQKFQPTTSTSSSPFNDVGVPGAHPGQLVDFTMQALPEFEVEDVHLNTLECDSEDSEDYFGLIPDDEHVTECLETTRSQGVARDSCCEKDLKVHLETVFNKQGKLKDNAEKAQAAVDLALMTKTCEIQRKPRTMPVHPSVPLEPVSRTVTKWSPARHPTDRIHTLPQATTAEQLQMVERRRSYVARCRSTDAFLRDVRESQKRRQLALTMAESRPGDSPDLGRLEQKRGDWLGNEPL